MAIDDGNPTATGKPVTRLSPQSVQALYEAHGRDVLTFLAGVLKNCDAAQDLCQLTFQRLLEAGHEARDETIRGWLFKVAFHEAMAFRRKKIRREQVQKDFQQTREVVQPSCSLDSLVKAEEVAQLRKVLNELPTEQRDVVQQRIKNEKTFAEIAAEMNVPLGTVLTRMRLAMQKLQRKFGRDGNESRP